MSGLLDEFAGEAIVSLVALALTVIWLAIRGELSRLKPPWMRRPGRRE